MQGSRKTQIQCTKFKSTQDFPEGNFSTRPPQLVNMVQGQDETDIAVDQNDEEEDRLNEYPQYPEEDCNQQSSEETDWETPDYWLTQGHQ